jgi:hypothetical protein
MICGLGDVSPQGNSTSAMVQKPPAPAIIMTTSKTKHDLSHPDYCPPHVRAWARVDYPAWVQPYVGIDGMPPAWQ